MSQPAKLPHCRGCGKRTDRVVALTDTPLDVPRHVWECASCEYRRVRVDAANAAQALEHFDPLLVQLARNDTAERAIVAEGFTIWEIQAVRTLLRRADTAASVPAGQRSHARPLATGAVRT